MRSAGGEVDEERLVWNERLLLPDPVDRLVGHVVYKVVSLFGGLRGLDRNGAFIECGIPLVRLAADESVEVLESAAAGWPRIERTGRAGLPHRHLMALAELSSRVAIQLERFGEGRAGVRQNRVITRRTAGDLGDAAHAYGVMVAARQQGLPRRRTKCSGMKTVVFEPFRCQHFGVGRVAWAAEGAR